VLGSFFKARLLCSFVNHEHCCGQSFFCVIGLKYSTDTLADDDDDDDHHHHRHTNTTIIVDIVTEEFDFRQCKRFRFSPKLSDCLCVPPSLLLNGYRWFFPQT
jgi:hypothetical protein